MNAILLRTQATLFFLLSFVGFTQEGTEYSGTYTWRESVTMYRCDVSGTPKPNQFESSRANQSFVVIKEMGDSVMIRILDYGGRPETKWWKIKTEYKNPYLETPVESILDSSITRTIRNDSLISETFVSSYVYRKGMKSQDTLLYRKVERELLSASEYKDSTYDEQYIRKGHIKTHASQYTFVPSSSFYKYNFSGSEVDFHSLPKVERNARCYGANQIYFKVSKNQIDNKTYYKEKSTLAVGVINFPFKARLQGTGDFSGSFNFGTAVGLKFAKKNYRSWSFSLISGYSISNIRLDQASVSLNKDILEKSNDYSALTLSIGPLVTNKNVQVGLFIGIDMLSRQNQETFNWYYNKKPWLSIGFGYAIFSNDGKRKSVEKNEQSIAN